MKYTAMILLAAFVITPFVLSCDGLSLDNSKVTKLEERVSKLETNLRALIDVNKVLIREKTEAMIQKDAVVGEYKRLAKQYNSLVDVNKVLIKEREMYKDDASRLYNENQDLKDRLAMAHLVIKEQDRQALEDNVSKLSFQVDFDHGKLYNKADSGAVSEMVLAYAEKNDYNVKITIDGYSSKAGPAKLNKWYSKERAEGVMHAILSAAGNNAMKLNINYKAHGETDDDQRRVIVTVEVL